MTDISTKRYNLDNFEASFREFLQNEGVSAPTLKNYLSDLRHFMGWFTFYLHSKHGDNLKPEYTELSSLASMIDFEAVSSYKVYLESNALPIKTINRRLSTLRKFCSFCINQNWMKENPAKRVTNIGSIHERRDGACPVSTEKPNNDGNVETQNFASLQNEFKQHLLSEQAKQKDVDLIMEDVNEFMGLFPVS